MILQGCLKDRVIMKKIAETQSFEDFTNFNYIYIDKTEQIYQITQKRKIFISRPRRFGKSLMLNTIGTLFKHGVDPYFKNTWIYDKWDEQKYLVLRLDFLSMSCTNFKDFCIDFDNKISKFAKLNKLKYESSDSPQRSIESLFFSLEEMEQEKQQKIKIVILIDEYDAQLSANINNQELYETFRISLRELYGAFKGSTSIRFLGITGVTRFHDVSIFSAGSDINDLSYHTCFSTIIGFTREEIRKYYIDYINLTVSLIHKISEEQVTEEQRNKFLDQLAEEYDGYCFDERYKKKVFSTWSVNNFFSEVSVRKKVKFADYWYDNGGNPTILENYLKTHTIKFDNYVEDISLPLADFKNPRTLQEMKQEVLMCQTGYLTLHSSFFSDLNVTLGIPNNEVYRALTRQLAPKIFDGIELTQTINEQFFLQASPQEIVDKFNTLMNTLSYDNYKNVNEKIVQGLLHAFLVGAFQPVKIEVQSARGRSDIELEYDSRRLIFELKCAETENDCEKKLQEAIDQIKNKSYGDVLPNKEVLKLALVFNADQKVRQFTHFDVVK